MADSIRFTVSIPGERPLLMNEVLGKHWRHRSPRVKEWKNATAQQLITDRIKGTHHRAKFYFRPAYPTNQLPDTANIYPTTKAIVDAVVEAGLLVEDKPGHNAFEGQYEPVVDGDLKYPVIDVLMVPEAAVVGHGPGECRCRESYEHSKINTLITKAGLSKGSRQ